MGYFDGMDSVDQRMKIYPLTDKEYIYSNKQEDRTALFCCIRDHE